MTARVVSKIKDCIRNGCMWLTTGKIPTWFWRTVAGIPAVRQLLENCPRDFGGRQLLENCPRDFGGRQLSENCPRDFGG